MKYFKELALFVITVLVIMLCGCSKSDSPTMMKNQLAESPLPQSGIARVIDGMEDGIWLFGEYQLSIKPASALADLFPVRKSTIGESYIVDGKSFFNITPCQDCLKIKSVELTSENYLKLKFAIRHPFNPGDPLQPPSGRNRLDLDIFDTALLVHPIGMTPSVYSLTGTSAYTGILTQNAGYTTELTNVISDPVAIPYVLIIDDDLTGTPSYNEFAMGAEAEFSATFALSQPIVFDLYLTMGYGASAKKAQRLNPAYFNPEFNRKSSWKVNVYPPNGSDPPSMSNTWNDSDSTTVFPVRVEVFDWQIGATVNPDLTNPTDVYASSEVSVVSVEIPGMNPSLIQTSTADSGTGAPGDPLIYTLSFANENRLAAGDYVGLVKVSDQRIPGTPVAGGETDTLVSNPDGQGNHWFAIPEFATYQAFVAVIVTGCGPITGQVVSPSCPVNDLKNCQKVNFVVTASSGNGGDPITLYEADYDYDGVTFTADASNTDGIFNNLGPFIVADPCDSNIPRTFIVAFRATDSCDPPNVAIFATCDAIVTSCKPFVGDVSVAAINRGEAGQDAEQITSLDLDWDDACNTVEYAVERADGYTATVWTLVGTSTTSFYKFQPTGNDLDDDIRLRVIARAETGGNPLTDSDPSEEVFVLFMSNAGTITSNTWAVYQENMAFRFAYWWSTAPGYADVDSWPVSTNRNFMGLYNQNSPFATNAWTIARTPRAVPDLVGQKRAFCDGYWMPNYPFDISMGLCIGTVSNPTPPAGPDNCDFKASNTPYGTGMTYNRSDSAVNAEFCTSNQDAWVFPLSIWTHVGYYLNDLCDDDTRDYIAFGWAVGATNFSWISGYSDGFVFIVD